MNYEKSIKDRRFECQKCVLCCSEMTLIYPGRDDINKLADYFGISELSFAIRYLQEVYDPYTDTYAAAFKTNHPGINEYGCIFCQDGLCAIYDSSRMDLCNVFPWNHFDLELGEWEQGFISSEGGFWCPGIGKGRVWSLQEIEQIKRDYPNSGKNTKYIISEKSKYDIDLLRPSGFNLTMSEENLIIRLRSLSIEKKQKIESFIDNL